MTSYVECCGAYRMSVVLTLVRYSKKKKKSHGRIEQCVIPWNVCVLWTFRRWKLCHRCVKGNLSCNKTQRQSLLSFWKCGFSDCHADPVASILFVTDPGQVWRQQFQTFLWLSGSAYLSWVTDPKYWSHRIRKTDQQLPFSEGGQKWQHP